MGWVGAEVGPSGGPKYCDVLVNALLDMFPDLMHDGISAQVDPRR